MKYIDRIRALREDRDLTQTDVANLLNIGQKTYSDYELEKTRIPLDSMLVLAKYYDVSMDLSQRGQRYQNPISQKIRKRLLTEIFWLAAVGGFTRPIWPEQRGAEPYLSTNSSVATSKKPAKAFSSISVTKR